jgi:hypothetical protein
MPLVSEATVFWLETCAFLFVSVGIILGLRFCIQVSLASNTFAASTRSALLSSQDTLNEKTTVTPEKTNKAKNKRVEHQLLPQTIKYVRMQDDEERSSPLDPEETAFTKDEKSTKKGKKFDLEEQTGLLEQVTTSTDTIAAALPFIQTPKEIVPSTQPNTPHSPFFQDFSVSKSATLQDALEEAIKATASEAFRDFRGAEKEKSRWNQNEPVHSGSILEKSQQDTSIEQNVYLEKATAKDLSSSTCDFAEESLNQPMLNQTSGCLQILPQPDKSIQLTKVCLDDVVSKEVLEFSSATVKDTVSQPLADQKNDFGLQIVSDKLLESTKTEFKRTRRPSYTRIDPEEFANQLFSSVSTTSGQRSRSMSNTDQRSLSQNFKHATRKVSIESRDLNDEVVPLVDGGDMKLITTTPPVVTMPVRSRSSSQKGNTDTEKNASRRASIGHQISKAVSSRGSVNSRNAVDDGIQAKGSSRRSSVISHFEGEQVTAELKTTMLGISTTLDFDNQQLTHFPPSDSPLYVILHSECQFYTHPFSHITVLILARNSINDLSGKCFIYMTSLEFLDISENLFTALPQEIEQLKALHTLLASRNKLTEFPGPVTNLNNIQHIDISENLISYIGSEILYFLISYH